MAGIRLALSNSMILPSPIAKMLQLSLKTSNDCQAVSTLVLISLIPPHIPAAMLLLLLLLLLWRLVESLELAEIFPLDESDDSGDDYSVESKLKPSF